jgi:hypothetical protein
MKRSSKSLAYVRTKVSADKFDGEWDYNPTNDPVEFAFTAEGGPTDETTWYDGSWEIKDSTSAHPKYFAKCLVGPSGEVELSTGSYEIWVKITDNPEIPIEYAGIIEVS